MRDLFMHTARSLVDWLFRRRSAALHTMRAGLICIVAALGAGLVLDVRLPFGGREYSFNINTTEGVPAVIVYTVAGLGILLTLGGVMWAAIDYLIELRRTARKRILVIEARGLRNSVGQALLEAVPHELDGHKETLLIDLRQGISDGEIAQPEAAVDELISLPTELKRRHTGSNRGDLTTVYGGLAPVPLTFLTGILMDDEDALVVLDWDRHAARWRTLDGPDDRERFTVHGLDNLPAHVAEVALTISVSYRVDHEGVREKIGDLPLVSLELPRHSPDNHWSETKQRALGKQFLDVIVSIAGRGTRRVHLFLAAQNSVVFGLGRLYDKRNLPELIVYQYQRDVAPPYPWGILMPVSGISRPRVVRAISSQR